MVDGNKKNHDDVCLAGNAGYAEYIPGRVQTGCLNSPVYKTQFCLHKPNLLNSLINYFRIFKLTQMNYVDLQCNREKDPFSSQASYSRYCLP